MDNDSDASIRMITATEEGHITRARGRSMPIVVVSKKGRMPSCHTILKSCKDAMIKVVIGNMDS